MRLTPNGPATPPAGVALLSNTRRKAEIAHVARNPGGPAIRAIEPNPVRGTSGLVRVTLADESPAQVELLDVSGRRIWSREVGALKVGDHAVRLGGATWIPAGVYLVRLTQGGKTATARVAIVR